MIVSLLRGNGIVYYINRESLQNLRPREGQGDFKGHSIVRLYNLRPW